MKLKTVVAAMLMTLAAVVIASGCKQTVTVPEAKDTTPPKEVTNLKAVTGDGKIRLSWTNPADTDLYQVEITASPAAGTLARPVYLSAEKGSAGSFMAEGLTGGQEYIFTVKTIDKTLNVGKAVTVKATPQSTGGGSIADTTAPAEVTELKAVTGDGKVSLSWKNPGDADLYQVEISASPAAGTLTNPVYLSAAKGKAMSFTAEGLSNGTAYTFTVKTIDTALNKSAGVSTAEAVKPIDTSDKTPPAEVTNLQAEALAGAIRLTWTDPADADLWGIEITSQQKIVTRSIAPIPENAILVAKGEQSRKISNLTVGQSYTFTVKTIDNSGNKSAGIKTTTVTPKAGEPMTLTPEQNPEQTIWTKDSVTITVKSNTSIKKAKWKKGSGHSAKDVLENGNSITGNSFTVSENGIYSVAVQDNDGIREVETIEIKNIDKTPPAAPTNLTAEYRFGEKKIILKWSDPVDTASGLKELKLSYTVNGANEKTETIAKGVQTLEIGDVNPQSTPVPYAFSLKAVDNAGNEGAAASITITPSAQAEVTGISLNRTHLDTLMSNRDIKVTITGSNFDKLTSLFVKVMDGSSSPVEATLDKPNNKATATVQAPTPTSPTDEGTEYIVKVFIDGTTESDKTATFKVSKPAEVKTITLSKNSIEFGTETKVMVSVTGTNFDIRGETKIKLLDSNAAEVTASTKIVPAGEGMATEFSAEIPVPGESGFYTVAVYFDEVKESKTSSLQLYGAPEITSVSIPKAGTSYGGNKLPVTITGKNFTAPGASLSESGASITNFKVVNDTFATAEVTCPYSAGEHTVTVMCGTESSKTGTISVKDYTGYEVGKIVLANNTLVDKAGYTIDASKPPVGIICGDSYGVPRMIALHTSGSGLVWAKNGSTGYNTTFEGIICTPSPTGSGAAETATFTGDTDGSDNWEYIKQQDPAGAADAATNYPAFHWVDQYNTQYAAQLGGTNFAWYMPSLAELCEVYKNKDKINASLKTIHDASGGSAYADESLGTNSYWSSSQFSNLNNFAWGVDFSDGYVGGKYKDDNLRVCCLSGF